MKNFKNKNHEHKIFEGFTLAEVLITLGIIGIVASLTIPTLMNNIQDAQLKSAWKKEYSVYSQAVKQMIQDNGGSAVGLFSSNDTAKDALKPYVSYVKECSNGTAFGNCWASHYKTLNGTWDETNYWGNYSGLVLKDGSAVMFNASQAALSSNCTWVITADLSICGYIIVDVTGLNKGPNVVGRDIYSAWITKDGVLPEGCMQDGRLSGCLPNTSGSCYSGKYLME